jgi:hypothetical protein
MRDYVVYHNPDRMPHPVSAVQSNSAFTDKDVTNAVGARIWVVGRDGSRYLLGAVFRATQRIAGQYGFRNGLAGEYGCRFGALADISSEAWFANLQSMCGNFAFGFTEITEPSVIAGLTAVAAANGCSSLP